MDIHSEYKRIYGYSPAWLVRAPGRVNLLGEHVDYNDGVVLPAAIDRAVHLALGPADDGSVRLNACVRKFTCPDPRPTSGERLYEMRRFTR